MSGFLDEMYAIGTLTEDHATEHNGEHWTTPSLIDHDDGKENPNIGDHANPFTQA